MLDVDSFQNILEVVRVCVKANRSDLIEPALVDRLHASEVRDRIATERAAQPAAAVTPASRSIFGEPTPQQRAMAAGARRLEAMAKGGT